MESKGRYLPESPALINENAALGSRPPHPPESTAALIKKFNEFKLETEFFYDYVVHQTCEWKHLSSSRSWETSVWRKNKMIGKGGFGTVWLEEKDEGEKEGGKQLRAVKVLPRESLPEAARSQELLALVKLSEYDHLFVQFLGWYEDQHQTFLAMEYIEHGDLSEYIKYPRARAEAQEITRQILEGLEVLHGKEICHRDLKPQNILVASLDPLWVKIADFGGSKRVKNTVARTRIFSSGYTAPEMLGVVPPNFVEQGSNPYAMDIWSLGSLVHKLLTSETPFLEPLYPLDINPETGLSVELSERGTDYASLGNYCYGKIEFPIDILQKPQLREEDIAFVKSLLVANPKDRPTATCALHSPWLTGPGPTYTSDYVQKLRSEFSCLGVDLDFGDMENILLRQVSKGDIKRFLPGSAKGQVSSLAYEAVANGYNLATVKLLWSSDCNPDGLTRGKLFQKAVENERLDIVEMLLQKNLHIGAYIGDQTVLHWAVESGDVNTVNLLLEKTNDDNSELLMPAIVSGNVDMVRILLSDRVDVNAAHGYDQTALQAAVDGGNIDIIRILLDNKADVNARAGASSSTALQAAAGAGNIDIVKLLLENKAHVNAKAAPDGGRTALQAACGAGHFDIVELLLDKKADINAKAAQDRGRTALQAACGAGHTDIVKLLLNNKAYVNAEAAQDRGRTALRAACGAGHFDIVELLLGKQADVNMKAVGRSGRTALQAACGAGHTDIVRLLLDNKAHVNAKAAPDGGRTALQAACGAGHFDIVELLLGKQADINMKAAQNRGRTALQAACGAGHTDIVKLLLDNKAYVNAEAAPYHGRTALQAACGAGHFNIVELLLDNKADINAKAVWGCGQTALQAACGAGHFDIVKLLLVNKADVNAEAAWDHGRSALQAACGAGHIDIVEFLLVNNADVTASAARVGGVTALQAAESSGIKDVVEIIKASTP